VVGSAREKTQRASGRGGFDERALLESLLDFSDLLVVVLDLEGRIVVFNHACERLTGRAAAEVTGKAVWDELLAPEEAGAVRAVFDGLAAGRFPSRHENRWLATDGTGHLVQWSNTVIRRRDGSVGWVIGTGIDVTEDRRARAALEDQRLRLQAILETAVDAIVIIDEAGIVQQANPAVQRLFGYTPEELVGGNVSLLMPSPDRERHGQYIRNYLRTGEARIIGIGREVLARRKDGSLLPVELAVSEVRLPGRRLFAGSLRDISDRKRAEEQARVRLDELAHASRLTAMGEMAAGIAHEINQPLSAIVSFAGACLRILRSGQAEPAVLERALEQIVAQGERAGGIIRRMRDFVRKRPTERVPVDVNATVREVLALLEHLVRRHRIRIRLELDERLPEVTGDPVQIEQVTLNLVRNAIEAMAEADSGGGELAIRTSADGRDVIEVIVADTGRGVDPEHEERLFEPFFSTKPSGMGIGLALTRSIVEAHGGRLGARRNPEGGMTFQFSLPITAGP